MFTVFRAKLVQQLLSVPFGALLLFIFSPLIYFRCCFRAYSKSLPCVKKDIFIPEVPKKNKKKNNMQHFYLTYTEGVVAGSFALRNIMSPVKRRLKVPKFFCILSTCAGQQHGGLRFAWGSHLIGSFPLPCPSSLPFLHHHHNTPPPPPPLLLRDVC